MFTDAAFAAPTENVHIKFNFFPHPTPENRAVYEIIWKKYCTAGQATDVTI